jgi:hypothetical protein
MVLESGERRSHSVACNVYLAVELVLDSESAIIVSDMGRHDLTT